MSAAATQEFTPATLSAFQDSLKGLAPAEVKNRKIEFMTIAIDHYGTGSKKYQKTLIFMGIISVLFLPLFVISIPTYLHYLSTSGIRKKNIRWALDQWEKDLGSDYERLFEKLRNC